MDYKARVVLTHKQKERLNFRIDKNVVQAVKENLKMIGLDQSNFLTGFFANIVNNRKMPFRPLSNEEIKKAELSAELNALEGNWSDIKEIKDNKGLEKWLEEEDKTD